MSNMFFKPWSPSMESKQLLSDATEIISDYEDQGYTLTLRQLYYQFVARDLIENSERSYKNLGNLITRARMAGLISWTSIEDRNREYQSPWFEENEDNLLGDLEFMIRFDRWQRQDAYVEVWVEKEALGNVVSRACDKFQVPHLSCKGYLSASEAWRAGQRFAQKIEQGKHCVLIHLGDHDPSGIDMTRDNQERVNLFSNYEGIIATPVEVIRIALNRDQIDLYMPPPNPAKVTDSRAKDYIKRHGRVSWELDALEPSVIEKLITEEVTKYIDTRRWDTVGDEEKQKKTLLHRLAHNWPEIKKAL